MTRSRSRTLVIVVAIAVGALAAGVFAGTRITSPADAAARTAPPTATAVTVPVERRTLESEVTTRGEAAYTGAVDVAPELAGLETSPVVTGQVPDVADEVKAGEVLLEVVGRPVIALAGDLPMYRTLRPGMSGPDVEQLEQALDALGFDPGTVDDTYTAATGRAVAELFDKAGYSAPSPDPEVQAELDAARDAVQAAEDEIADAESALQAASAGPSEAERVAAQNDVDQAERALGQAKNDGDSELVAEAEAQLKLAKATLSDIQKGPDTSAEQKMLDNARQRLSDAQNVRDTAATEAGTPLPASEVAFVSSLPRRVDDVKVRRGGIVEGAVMSISGADLVVRAEVDNAARELVEEGMEATIDLPGGDQITAPITRIREPSGDSSGHRVTITPADLTPDQVDELRDANVRVTIPVESTDGDVLAVPLAALTAGPGGEARIEVQRDAVDDGEETTELLEVEVGLTARGYAEVEPVNGSLEEGHLVIVGGEADTGDGEGESDDEG